MNCQRSYYRRKVEGMYVWRCGAPGGSPHQQAAIKKSNLKKWRSKQDPRRILQQLRCIAARKEKGMQNVCIQVAPWFQRGRIKWIAPILQCLWCSIQTVEMRPSSDHLFSFSSNGTGSSRRWDEVGRVAQITLSRSVPILYFQTFHLFLQHFL